MANFNIVLVRRNKRKGDLLDLCIRYTNKNDVMYLPLVPMDDKSYKRIFVDKSPEEKCINWREKCAGYITKCERLYNKMETFDKKEFRERFYNEKEDNVMAVTQQSMSLSNMFSEYVECGKLKHFTKKHYQTTVNILNSYKNDLTINDITIDFLREFLDDRMTTRKCSQATIDSYMRDLRSVINYFMKTKGITSNYLYPFGKGKIIISTYFPAKLVLSNNEIQSIVDFTEFETKDQEFARDIWLLLYRMNGSNFADLLRLKWTDIKGGYITFTRKKTEDTRKNNKKPIIVPYTTKVQEVISKLGDKNSPFILGKLVDGYSEIVFDNKSMRLRKKYNEDLKFLNVKLKLTIPLTLETARDSYATTLKRADVSTENISEMMGHSNVIVTEHYLGCLSAEKTIRINDCLM